MKSLTHLLAATALTAVALPAVAETWDMPLAYPATNFPDATMTGERGMTEGSQSSR